MTRIRPVGFVNGATCRRFLDTSRVGARYIEKAFEERREAGKIRDTVGNACKRANERKRSVTLGISRGVTVFVTPLEIEKVWSDDLNSDLSIIECYLNVGSDY